ncbi:sugar transferase [Candidatus Dojkabacteria bacterium]|jgi:lipopolysaccharide/colanic/teichoic acid biosynthesis glycosyltransferase|nr:sugar transferase [Candidatus Dojkabacteria bacterium]
MKLSRVVNRIIDLLVAVILLSFLWPIMAVVALAIKLEDSGDIFADIPERVGRDGVQFFMFKFRSMKANSHEEIQSDEKYKELMKSWIKQEKLSIGDDPRITKIGRVIRRCDIDETPQLLNVLIGNMSIVGPRPFNKNQLERYLNKSKTNLKDYELIKTVKPGITGLWQVSGRNKNTIEQRFEIDRNYVEKKNILFDAWIMIKTPFEILRHIIVGENEKL